VAGGTLAVAAFTATTIAGSTITGSSVLSVDDTTESTSTTTGSIHTDGGLGVVGDIYAGDDVFFTSGAVLNFNAGDVTLTHTANHLTLAGGELIATLDATAVLANGVTGTTQSASDNSTKVATTAYADASGGSGTGFGFFLIGS
jgi:hypothetical protein